MKSGISIFNPTVDDVVAYGFKNEIEASARPLWLGTPNIKYASTLVMPTMLIPVFLYAAIEAISIHISYDGSLFAQRSAIVFDMLLFVLLIFNTYLVLLLTQVTYLITDKNVNIFFKDNFFANSSYSVRRACRICKSRVLKYDLSLFIYLNIYSSILFKNVGNISFLIFDPIYINSPNQRAGIFNKVILRKKKIKFVLTIFNIDDFIFSVDNLSSVSELLHNAINLRIDESNYKNIF